MHASGIDVWVCWPARQLSFLGTAIDGQRVRLTNAFTVIFKIELEGHWTDASMEILSEQI